MGKAGYVAGIVIGVILAIFGFFMFVAALATPGLVSWFAFFFALFIWVIAGIAFYGAHRAKPKKPGMLGTYRTG